MLIKCPLPNLTDLKFLTYPDMSNNSFDASDVPSWLSALPSLTTLVLEHTGIRGSLPVSLFSLPELQTVILRGNHLNGTLDVGAAYSTQLVLVDLCNNSVRSIVESLNLDFQLVLIDNPICEKSPNASRCKETPQSGTSYTTPKTCSSPKCNPDQVSSPKWICSYPSTGTLFFQAFAFSNMKNLTYYTSLEKSLMTYFSSHQLPVDSVSLSNPKIASSTLKIGLEIFPLGELQFNTTGISAVQTPLSNRKSRIRLDWRGRVEATLDAASGLQYLHEHADPPIIHRDIKSNNILLDEAVTAKVSDFGLSKAFVANKETYSTTLVKGTMGYLDPEYFMTRIPTEKSDVYGFGVMMLEIATGRAPIEHGKYIVTEVTNALDKSRELYNLHELFDPTICFSTTLGGLEHFVDVALSCVQDSASTRPAMREVVKDLEAVMEAACLNPLSESPSSSCVFSDPSSSGFAQRVTITADESR